MNRPPDAEKPMFKGMVDAIPITLKVDTILLDDAQVVYTELGEGKSEGGTLGFEQINGTITRLTTLPEEQSRYESSSSRGNSSTIKPILCRNFEPHAIFSFCFCLNYMR